MGQESITQNGQEGSNDQGQAQGSNDQANNGSNNDILNGGDNQNQQSGQNADNGDILSGGDDANNNNNADGQTNAPEKYEPFKLDDGVAMSDENFSSFSELAKGLNLSQEQAQSLVDFQSNVVKTNHQENLAKSNEITEAWKRESLEMLGEQRQAKIAIANKALDRRPDLKNVLADTGLINHPEVLKLVIEFGKMTSEDVLVDGNTSKNDLSREKVLYGDTMK